MSRNRYNIPTEILEKALKNMQNEGYVDKNDTVDDLISFTRSMCEDDSYIVVAKIYQWADS